MQRLRGVWSGGALSFWSVLLGWELAAAPYFCFILFWYSAFIYLSAVVCWQTLAFKLTFLTNVQTGIAWIGILNINNLSICCETNLIYLLCFSHIVRKGYNKCKISAVVSTSNAWIFHYLFKHLAQSPDRNVSNQAHYSRTTWNVECIDMNIACSPQFLSSNYSSALFVEFENAFSSPILLYAP